MTVDGYDLGVEHGLEAAYALLREAGGLDAARNRLTIVLTTIRSARIQRLLDKLGAPLYK